MLGFIEIKSDDGRGMLLNLDLVVAFREERDGSALAVTLAGSSIKLAEKYKDLKEDLEGDDEPGDGKD